jgi:hypothetical protein
MKPDRAIAVLAGTYASGRPKNRCVGKYTLDYVMRTRKLQYAGVWRKVEPVTFEELKGLQSQRVPFHRTKIANKLAEYGHTCLKPVDPQHYRDYKRFLLTLPVHL